MQFTLTFVFSFLLISQTVYSYPEDKLRQDYQDIILKELNKTRQIEFFDNEGRTNYTESINQSSKNTPIIIMPGRGEALFKYHELAYDLLQTLDHPIYLFQHLTQGKSTRGSLENPKRHHTNGYEKDYYLPAKKFIEKVKITHDQNPIVIAHSMGGHIATHVAISNPGLVKGLILSAPMYKIETGMPKWLARSIAWTGVKLGQAESYAPGVGDFNEEKEFEGNVVTTSKERFQHAMDLFKASKESQVGGPTFGWLYHSLNANSALFDLVDDSTGIELPILLLQAGEEKVVGNKKHNKICEKLTKCTIKTIAGANHEIYQESETIRQQAMSETLDFIDQLNN